VTKEYEYAVFFGHVSFGFVPTTSKMGMEEKYRRKRMLAGVCI